MRIITFSLIFISMSCKTQCHQLSFQGIDTATTLSIERHKCYELLYEIEEQDSNIVVTSLGTDNPNPPKIELNYHETIHNITPVIDDLFKHASGTPSSLVIAKSVGAKKYDAIVWTFITIE